MYGIFNAKKKEFQFGICEESKTKAWKKLNDKIGKDAYMWRFEVRKIPDSIVEKVTKGAGRCQK